MSVAEKPRIIGPRASIIAHDTAHAAASHSDQALAGWYPDAGSADADLLDELGTIVPRSRDLARNNGYVSGANQTFADNIIGSQLVLASNPDARLLGIERDEAKALAKQIESQFATWAHDPYEIDAGRSLSLIGMAIQAIGGWFLNGDALAIPHWQLRPGARWNTRLQVIEADRLETPPSMIGDTHIRGGIRVDQFGAPLGYYIRSPHPGDMYGVGGFAGVPRYRYIKAFTDWGRRRVIHLHDKERSGQSRGKPLVASVMREFRMATHYTRTELQATIANSLVAAFLKSNLSQDAAGDLLGATDLDSATDSWHQSIKDWNPRLRSGAVIPLPLGADIEGFQPNRPNQAFEGFMLSVLRNISAGLNIPYELLAKDFSKTNYSSARASLLEAWRYFQSRRRWLSDHFLTPIYELWLEEAVNSGVIVAPDYYANRYAYRRCTWTMSGRGWVDPLKEANAASVRMENNITTLRQECAEQGLDWEEVLEQRAAEQQMMRDLGIPSASTPEPAGDPEPDGDEQGEDQNESEDKQAA